jgi:hypothetical protein
MRQTRGHVQSRVVPAGVEIQGPHKMGCRGGNLQPDTMAVHATCPAQRLPGALPHTTAPDK